MLTYPNDRRPSRDGYGLISQLIWCGIFAGLYRVCPRKINRRPGPVNKLKSGPYEGGLFIFRFSGTRYLYRGFLDWVENGLERF